MTTDGHRSAETTDISAVTGISRGGDETIEIDVVEMTETEVVLDGLLDELYAGQERITQAEIHRRAVAAEVPADVLIRITAMPEGEYAMDEAAELLGAREAK